VVDGNGAADRVIPVGLGEAQGGHHQQPVRVDAARLVQLGAADHHSAGLAPHHAQEEIGVGLFMRRAAAIALGVGHGSADDKVLPLHAFDKVDEARVIGGSERPIDLEGDRIEGVDGVHAYAALKAGSRALPEPPLHAILRHHVFDALRHVQESIHQEPAQLRRRRPELGVVSRQAIRLGHGVDRGADQRVIHRIVDQFAEGVDPQLSAS
jgi:hypothetical protein